MRRGDALLLMRMVVVLMRQRVAAEPLLEVKVHDECALPPSWQEPSATVCDVGLRGNGALFAPSWRAFCAQCAARALHVRRTTH
jgi:hypothetical protein